ncbi:MAG: hypothetical protein Tsb0034_17070 [Ekhidna sp.]
MYRIIAFFITITPFFLCGQSIDLSLNLEKGKTYRHQLSSRADITQDIGGDLIETRMTISGDLEWRVKSSKKESYTMEGSYLTVEIEMRLEEGNMKFSSDSKEGDVFTNLLKRVVGQPFTMEVNSKGMIEEIKGMDKVFDEAFETLRDRVDEEKLSRLRSQLTKAIGPDALKGNLQTVLSVFPGKTVSKGDTWQVATIFSDGMDAAISSTYQLDEVSANKVTISGTSNVRSRDTEQFFELNGKFFRYEINGNRKSTITIDRNSGWVKSASISQSLGGDSYLQPADELDEEITIPITIDNEITISDQKK